MTDVKKYVELAAVLRLIQYELGDVEAFEKFSGMQVPRVAKESYLDLQERVEQLPTIEVKNGICKKY